MGRTLLEGGLPVAEATFRTANAAESIWILRSEFPTLLVGAGTVITLAQAQAAFKVGVSYAVTPGSNPRIVDFFIAKGIPVVPGVNSPSQVEMGLESGLEVLEFFPSEASGGVKMLKALYGPYSEVKFVPTSRVDGANLASYLVLPNVVACGGSWMVKEDFIASGRFDEIATACLEAVALALSSRKKRDLADRFNGATRTSRTVAAGTGIWIFDTCAGRYVQMFFCIFTLIRNPSDSLVSTIL